MPGVCDLVCIFSKSPPRRGQAAPWRRLRRHPLWSFEVLHVVEEHFACRAVGPFDFTPNWSRATTLPTTGSRSCIHTTRSPTASVRAWFPFMGPVNQSEATRNGESVPCPSPGTACRIGRTGAFCRAHDRSLRRRTARRIRDLDSGSRSGRGPVSWGLSVGESVGSVDRAPAGDAARRHAGDASLASTASTDALDLLVHGHVRIGGCLLRCRLVVSLRGLSPGRFARMGAPVTASVGRRHRSDR